MSPISDLYVTFLCCVVRYFPLLLRMANHQVTCVMSILMWTTNHFWILVLYMESLVSYQVCLYITSCVWFPLLHNNILVGYILFHIESLVGSQCSTSKIGCEILNNNFFNLWMILSHLSDLNLVVRHCIIGWLYNVQHRIMCVIYCWTVHYCGLLWIIRRFFSVKHRIIDGFSNAQNRNIGDFLGVNNASSECILMLDIESLVSYLV